MKNVNVQIPNTLNPYPHFKHPTMPSSAKLLQPLTIGYLIGGGSKSLQTEQVQIQRHSGVMV